MIKTAETHKVLPRNSNKNGLTTNFLNKVGKHASEVSVFTFDGQSKDDPVSIKHIFKTMDSENFT